MKNLGDGANLLRNATSQISNALWETATAVFSRPAETREEVFSRLMNTDVEVSSGGNVREGRITELGRNNESITVTYSNGENTTQPIVMATITSKSDGTIVIADSKHAWSIQTI
jgi:hypothetical protein